MSASTLPIMRYLNLTAGGTGTITFGQSVGRVTVRVGGANKVYMAVGATPPTPSAGDGRVEVSPDAPMVLKNVSLMQLSFSMEALKASYVECIGIPVLAGR